jgi:GT2 family glycosyltransferase
MTIKCIHSLMQLDYPSFEIIVVDNASVDDSVQRIQAVFPDITLIRSTQNLGFAGGHRLALEQAQQAGADLFWILNNDTAVRPDTLSALVEAYHLRGAAVYGSVTLRSAETRLIAFGGGWYLDPHSRPRAIGDYNPLRGKSFDDCFSDRRERVVAAVNGSSLMVPLSVVRQYRFMDETFFMNGEETDYCFRLWRKGIPSILVPASLVVHEIGGSYMDSSRLRTVLEYYQMRNRLEVIRRYEGRWAYWGSVWRALKQTWKMQIWSLVSPRKAQADRPKHYYETLGIRHAVLHRMGKTFAPEDFRN